MNNDRNNTPKDPDIERERDDLAHALRSPLTALRGGLDLLNESSRDGLNDVSRRGLDVALSATRRLTALIDDTLLLARHRAGRLELVLSVETASEVVREALRGYKDQRSSQDLEFDLELVDTEVVADVALMTPVIGRLIDLTSTASDTVRIHASTSEDTVLFEFSSVSTSSTSGNRQNRAAQTAIAMCKAVIELHGGTLILGDGSSTESPGTTASFTLPTAD